MKKSFLIIFFCLFSVLSFAQNYAAAIENQFRDYNNLIAEKKFESALDLYGNEDFLKLFQKKDLIQLMDQMFNSPDVKFKIYPPEEVVVSDNLVESNGKKYMRLSYKQNLDMKFEDKMVESQLLLQSLQKEFGAGNVSFNQQTGYYQIITYKDAVASSTDLNKWKFAVIEEKQLPILRQFIPAEILYSK